LSLINLKIMDNTNKAFAVQNKLERTRHFMGGYWTFLLNGSETNGQFALMEVNLRRGLEPPAHTHTNEDETFHVLEGEITVTADNVEHHLKAGELIHLPRGVVHSFKVQTEKVKMLAHVAPAGLEEMFIAMSTPADQLDYPSAPVGPPPPEVLQRIGALQEQYGIIGMQNKDIKTV